MRYVFGYRGFTTPSTFDSRRTTDAITDMIPVTDFYLISTSNWPSAVSFPGLLDTFSAVS